MTTDSFSNAQVTGHNGMDQVLTITIISAAGKSTNIIEALNVGGVYSNHHESKQKPEAQMISRWRSQGLEKYNFKDTDQVGARVKQKKMCLTGLSPMVKDYSPLLTNVCLLLRSERGTHKQHPERTIWVCNDFGALSFLPWCWTIVHWCRHTHSMSTVFAPKTSAAIISSPGASYSAHVNNSFDPLFSFHVLFFLFSLLSLTLLLLLRMSKMSSYIRRPPLKLRSILPPCYDRQSYDDSGFFNSKPYIPSIISTPCQWSNVLRVGSMQTCTC